MGSRRRWARFGYPSVLDPDGRKAVDWGVFGVPETFLVDPTGRVRAKVVGAVNRAWLITNARDLVAEAEAGCAGRSRTEETGCAQPPGDFDPSGRLHLFTILTNDA